MRLLLRPFLLLAAGVCLAASAAAAALPDLPWSDPATWGGAAPVAGDAVVIPAGKRVLLDVTPPPLKSIVVNGELVFARRDLNLSAEWIMVHGRLEIGSPAQPFTQRATITLLGEESDFDIGCCGMSMGTKSLSAMRGGTLAFYGATPPVVWTKLAADAPAGSSVLTLAAAPGWQAGDRVVLAPSGFDPFETEERVLTAVSGKTVTLDRPLAFRHHGTLQTVAGRVVDERAEIGVLDRRIVVRGQNSQGSHFGGQVMLGMEAIGRFHGVEFTGLGQLGRLGRYPLHFHLLADLGAQSAVERCSFHHNFQRHLVLHQTDGVLVSDNVAYDTIGSAFFLEDGKETGNRFLRNLVLLVRKTPEEKRLSIPEGEQIGRGERQAAFWITNSGNDYVGNSAAAVEHGMGFWFTAPDRPVTLDAYGEGTKDFNPPMGLFEDNVAHTISFLDEFVFNLGYGPEQAGSGATFDVFHSPYDYSRYTPNSPVLRFLAYKCRNAGLWDANHMPVRHAVLVDNRVAFNNPQGSQVVFSLHDSLILTQSANQPPGRAIANYFASVAPGPFDGPYHVDDLASAGSSLVDVGIVGPYRSRDAEQDDRRAPRVLNLATPDSELGHGLGDVLTLVVRFSKDVYVTDGRPTLKLNNGALATYVGGSGTSALSFRFTIAPGHDTKLLNHASTSALSAAGASLRDHWGRNAVLTLPSLASTNSLAKNVPIRIYTGLKRAGDVVTVVGTSSADVVTIDGTLVSTYEVRVNGILRYVQPGVTRFVFKGGAGNDKFTNNTEVPCEADGEDGDDILTGGWSDDLLVGGLGKDSFNGRAGRDTARAAVGEIVRTCEVVTR
jgi:hypothetical protein